jgi:hypothetical protein
LHFERRALEETSPSVEFDYNFLVVASIGNIHLRANKRLDRQISSNVVLLLGIIVSEF